MSKFILFLYSSLTPCLLTEELNWKLV